MTRTYADAEATALGFCLTCGEQHGHADWCPVPHVGWAQGDERCDRCRHGLDAGEGYLAPVTGRLGTFEVAEGLTCLPCGLTAG